MEEISSVEAEVCSSEAACSEAPSASDWLAPETIDAAPETLSAPCDIRKARSLSDRLALRTVHKTTAPTASAISISATVTALARELRAAEEAADADRSRF